MQCLQKEQPYLSKWYVLGRSNRKKAAQAVEPESENRESVKPARLFSGLAEIAGVIHGWQMAQDHINYSFCDIFFTPQTQMVKPPKPTGH